MRDIPADALNTIAQEKGVEPVNIIRVQWIAGGAYFYYADRAIDGIDFIYGRLISLADLEAVLDVNKSVTSTSVKVSLDDIDGSIKAIFDVNDIHGRPVAIMQWFTNLPIGSAFIIFEGMIASPIEWSEGGRTLNFDAMTRIEDIQAGFSIEDGQFTNIPTILVGKPWPLVFGTVINMPTLQMDEMPSGTTRIDLGIPEENSGRQSDYHNAKAALQAEKAMCLSLRGAEMQFLALSQANTGQGGASSGLVGLGQGNSSAKGAAKAMFDRGTALQRQATDLIKSSNQQSFQGSRLKSINQAQKGYDASVIPIINGHLFQQNTPIVINIKGAMYAGSFSGDNFLVTSRQAPQEATPKSPGSSTANGGSAIKSVVIQGTQEASDGQLADLIFGGQIVLPDNSKSNDSAAYWACQPPYFISGGAPQPKANQVGQHQHKNFFFAPAGSSVKVGDLYPIRYILSITPNTVVLWLSAEITDQTTNIRTVTPIPPNYYSISTLQLGDVVATIATFPQPMSTLKTEDNDLDWGDKIYATLESPIGPNVVDEMIYIIQTWTQYGIDPVSFNYVRAKVDPYPANWALLTKKNVVELLKDMAFQSRCAIYLQDNVWHLTYLSEQGPSVDTLTEDDIVQQSLVVTTTATEDLVTRYTAEWRATYDVTDLNQIILQYNVNKYGVHEETYDYYIYNVEELVAKSALFWMIRKSNVFKILKCKTVITKLRVETLDSVTVDLEHNFTQFGAVVGVANKATFDSENFAIDMEIWLPVRLGEMILYDFAYPAGLSTQDVFPTITDVAGLFPSSTANQQDQGTGDLGNGQSGNTIPPLKYNGTKTQTPPADVFNATPQGAIPFVTATPAFQTPNYAGGGSVPTNPNITVIPGSGNPSPRFDTVNRHAEDPAVTAETPEAARSYPGYITDKVDDTHYKAVIFPNGLDDESQDLPSVRILDVDAKIVIPSKTWGIFTAQSETDSDGNTKITYYYQPAVWLADSDAAGGGGNNGAEVPDGSGDDPDEDDTTEPDSGTGDAEEDDDGGDDEDDSGDDEEEE